MQINDKYKQGGLTMFELRCEAIMLSRIKKFDWTLLWIMEQIRGIAERHARVLDNIDICRGGLTDWK